MKAKKKKIETTKFKPFTVQKQFNQSKEKLNKSSKKKRKVQTDYHCQHP